MIGVTGACGFIGSWLSLALSNEKLNLCDVEIGVDILSEANREHFVNKSTTIVHLAAISGIKDCEKNPVYAYLLNRDLTIDLCKEAKKAGVRRFVFASSSAVYGEAMEYLIDEKHPCEPRGVYGKSKLEAEMILDFASRDFEVVILRKSNVYGFGTKWKGKTVVDQFIERYIAKEPIEIVGNGMQKRDFLHIMDAVRLYAQIARANKCRSGIYNVGGPETISIRGLADLVNDIGESIFGHRVPIVFKDGQSGAGWHDFKYDFSKARMEFQYEPKFSLDDAIKERLLLEMRERYAKK